MERKSKLHRFMVVLMRLKNIRWDFPGGPVVKTLCFHCKGHRFGPWSGN